VGRGIMVIGKNPPVAECVSMNIRYLFFPSFPGICD
jgi:hypothetical protein